MRFVRIFTAVALAFACAAAASATANAKSLFDLEKNKALVIMQMTKPADGKPYANVGTLVAGSFDPVTKGNKVTPVSGWLSFETIDDPVTRQRWYVGQVNAGDVAFYDFVIDRVGLCFNKSTYHFNVEAGKTYVVGSFNPKPYIRRINTIMMTNRLSLSLSQSRLHYFFDETLENYTQAHDIEDIVPQTSEFLMNMKQPEREIITPVLNITDFNTGRDAFGVSKLCRGYYSGK